MHRCCRASPLSTAPRAIELPGAKGPRFPTHACCHRTDLCMMALLPCCEFRARARASSAAVQPAGALAQQACAHAVLQRDSSKRTHLHLTTLPVCAMSLACGTVHVIAR